MSGPSALSRILVASLLVLLALEGGASAQNAPSLAHRALHIGSPPKVLNDPIVKRCRVLAARRMDPSENSMTSAVEKATAILDVELVFDAVAACRAALMAYPNEPQVIIAHYNAMEILSAIVLGANFPDSNAQAHSLALREAEKAENATGFGARMFGFFLGSAYEYGVGINADRLAAIRWYAVAARAGDPISQREMTRLQRTLP